LHQPSEKHEWITRDRFGYISERSLRSTGRVTFQRREKPRDEAREL